VIREFLDSTLFLQANIISVLSHSVSLRAAPCNLVQQAQ